MSRGQFPHYEAATGCVNAGPGAAMMLRWMLVESSWKGIGRNWGVCNCRLVRGAHSPSVHGECRAWDLGLPYVNGRPNPAGDEIIDWLLPRVHLLGIQMFIWDRHIWSRAAPGGRRYGGVHPHRDHIHAEQTRHSARHLNGPTIRAAAGNTIIVGVTPTPEVAFGQQPEEDEEMAVVIEHEDGGVRLHRGGIYCVLNNTQSHQANRENIDYWTFLSGRKRLDLRKNKVESDRWLNAGVEVSHIKGAAMNAQALAKRLL